MKSVAYEVIDGIKIVRAIGEPTIDPELTKREARKRLERSEEYKSFDHAYLVCSGEIEASLEEIAAAKTRLFKGLDEIVELRRSIAHDNPIYFHIPGEALVDDGFAEELRKALYALDGRELLALDGEVLIDDRGRRAWLREDSGRWDYVTISKLGEQPPEGYHWHEGLKPSDLDEVRAQMDRDRIEAMPLEERQARAREEIDAALDGLVQRHMRAQVRGFGSALTDLRATFDQVRKQILEQYNLSEEVSDDEGRAKDPERAGDDRG